MNDPTEPTQLFQALSDPTRLRIVRMIAANREVCVCELVDSLEEEQYHVSRHLRELRDSGLLSTERDGRWVYYSLRGDPLVQQLARLVLDLPQDAFATDEGNFRARLKLRVGGRCRVGIQKQHLSESTTNHSGQA